VQTCALPISANALGALPVGEVPASLRQFVRFAPQKRARLAATPIAAALATDGRFRSVGARRAPAPPMAAPLRPDGGFRSVVPSRVREAMPDLAAALSAGAVPAAADPLEIAAVAYLLRPGGWQGP